MLIANIFSLIAQGTVHNPAISERYGGSAQDGDYNAGESLAYMFANFWMLAISLGGFTLIIYLIWGAYRWLTAGGDKAQLAQAQQHLSQAVIGMIVLSAVYAIVTFIGPIILGENFSILKIDWSRYAPPQSP